MQLVFEQIRVGGDRNFGYLLGDRDARQAVLVDPSYTPEALATRAAEQRLQVTYIVNTHGHDDHINGNARAVELTGAPVAGHPGLPTSVDVPLADGQELVIGTLRLRALATPGHAADHLVLHEASNDLLLTGDLLFVGKIGGTRSDEDARTEWASLQRLLGAVPETATVWPGHDYGVRPSSTIALEKRTNPFLQCRDVQALLDLKSHWVQFKTEHGLK
jgi:hydroxyacylglutathione hydrolase